MTSTVIPRTASTDTAGLEHAVLEAFDRGAEHATATSEEVWTRPLPRIDDGEPAPREHRSRTRPATA